jgi:CubicO group peptidase (beta-lactamase class C family)
MKRTLPALLTFFLLNAAALGQAPSTQTLEEQIAAEMKAGNIPGAAIVIVRDGRVVYSKGFGVASVEGGVPVTSETLFRLGSTTKTVVALGFMRLVEQGRVRLDVPISSYAPDLHPRIGALTLQQLLTHTAGLADDPAMNGPLDDTALAARIRALDDTAFFAEPGSIMSYSNPGYAVAGYILERVIGKPFAEGIADLVLRPLGMSHSGFRLNQAATYSLALGHGRGQQGAAVLRPFVDNAANYPPGSLFTSAEDGARLLVALLESSSAGPEALERGAVLRLSADGVAIPNSTSAYAHGVFVRTVGKETVLYNAGARLGYGSSLVLVPERRAGVLVMANRTGAMLTSVALRAMVDILPMGLLDESGNAGDSVPIPEQEARELVGIYQNAANMRAEIRQQNGTPLLVFEGREIPFTKDAKGRYHGAGPWETFVVVSGAGGRDRYICAQARALRKIK